MRRVLGVALSATSLLCVVAGMVLKISPWDGEDVGTLAAIVALVVVAVLLMVRRPDHPIAWLMTISGLVLGAGSLAWEYTERVAAGVSQPGLLGRFAAVAAGTMFFLLVYLLGCLLLLLFPTGRPPGRRWSVAAWTGGVAVAAIAGGSAYLVSAATFGELTSGEPLRTGVPWLDALVGAAIPILALSTVAAVVSLVVRYRRARSAERKQLQWFLAGAVVLIAGVVAEFIHQGPVSAIMLLAGVLALPAAIAIAVLRYRLYEIDRIVSRTVSYAGLTGLLAGVYLGVVLLLAPLVGRGSDLAVAGATLATAAAFGPLRRRVQAVVDRRFNRARYDAQRTVEAFAARLRDQVDLAELRDELLTAATTTMQPTRAEVWLRPTSGDPR